MPAGYGWTRTYNTCLPAQRGHLDTAFTASPSPNPPYPIVSFDWEPQPSTRHHHRMHSPLSPPLSAANSFSIFNYAPSFLFFYSFATAHPRSHYQFYPYLSHMTCTLSCLAPHHTNYHDVIRSIINQLRNLNSARSHLGTARCQPSDSSS